MTPPPDLIAALLSFLKGDTDVAALIGRQAFGGELPKSAIATMPSACVVLAHGGGAGAFGGGGQAYGDRRVDVRAYGATQHEAASVWNAVYAALKNLEHDDAARCHILWAKEAGGPIPLRDPDREWPYMWSSWQVLMSEIPVA